MQTEQIGTTRRHDAFNNTRWAPSKRARTYEFSPKVDDVLFYGDARLTHEHPGNQKFALLVKKCVSVFQDSFPIDDVAEAIMKFHEPHEGPSNFFERNKDSGRWSQLNTFEAVSMIKYTLQVETEQGKLNLLAMALDSSDGTTPDSAVIDEAAKSAVIDEAVKSACQQGWPPYSRGVVRVNKSHRNRLIEHNNYPVDENECIT